MNYTTVGIIGHVDHGKTSLVKALTGIDTDRLKEEKERGISITLGYAHLDLPAGQVGIIDAPGHERFIRTMIAGATGMRAVLLVVDVNEGVMPQTVEHLDIAGLLGIEHGVIALAKCDTVDRDVVDLAREELRELTANTFLRGAPIIKTSAATGEGLDAIRAALNHLLETSTPPVDEGYVYLPVDRVFSMPGFGTVVTGTLHRGSLIVGDEVEVYPRALRAKVRDLQSHSAFVDRVPPGRRTAVNLRGVDKQQLARGDIVATPASLTSATIANVHLSLLASATNALKNRQMVRVLFATTEVFARTHFLDRDELNPGDDCVLQLRLESPVPILNQERFIVRTYSPMTTIGGGRFLGIALRAFRRRDSAPITRLYTYAHRPLLEKCAAFLDELGPRGVRSQEIARFLRVPLGTLPGLLSANAAVNANDLVIGKTVFDGLTAMALSAITQFHAANPTLPGMPRDQLAAALPKEAAPAVIDAALQSLASAKRIALSEGLLRIANFRAGDTLSDADRALARNIADAFRQAGMTPPRVDEVIPEDRRQQRLYRYLLDQGELAQAYVPTRSKEGKAPIAFHRDTLAAARERLAAASNGQQFTTADAKVWLDLSRKYLIPLLESLDARGYTQRTGDDRTIKPVGAKPATTSTTQARHREGERTREPRTFHT